MRRAFFECNSVVAICKHSAYHVMVSFRTMIVVFHGIIWYHVMVSFHTMTCFIIRIYKWSWQLHYYILIVFFLQKKQNQQIVLKKVIDTLIILC